jgi:hypothetical protein
LTHTKQNISQNGKGSLDAANQLRKLEVACARYATANAETGPAQDFIKSAMDTYQKSQGQGHTGQQNPGNNQVC